MEIEQQKKNGNGKTIELTDMNKITLVAVYLVQKLGKPTLDEIIETAISKLNTNFDKKLLLRALKGAAKRAIVGIEQSQQPDGKNVTVAVMKTMAWKQPPEYAHVTDLLPALISTPALESVKAYFDSLEGKGSSKATRGNDIDDFRAYEVKGTTTDLWLGSQIPDEYSNAVRVKWPNSLKDDEIESIWERDILTGDYVVANDCIQGWFRTNITRLAGLADARANYFAFTPIRFPADTKVMQKVMPVMNSKTGASAPKKYEAIVPGQPFKITFTGPVKGGLAPEQLEKLFILCGIRPARGLSPARGKRFGHFKVTSFKCLGTVKDSDLDWIGDHLNDEDEYLHEAMTRLAGVKIGKGVVNAPDVPPLADEDLEEDA